MKYTNAIALAVIITTTGCATPANVSTPESISQSASTSGTSSKARATDFEVVKDNVSFKEHPHLGGRTATGPEIRYLDPNRNKWQDGYNIYKITAVDVGRSGPDIADFRDIQIHVRQQTSGEWPFYNGAYSNGQRLEFEKVDSDVFCQASICNKTEIIGINMSIDHLRELAEKPVFEFQVIGRNNNMIIQIPQSYIQGFLAAIDEIR